MLDVPEAQEKIWTTKPDKTNHLPETPEENLEDLLSYDDVFWDYFNHFLKAPVFPIGLSYNRLTGAFEDSQPNINENGSTETPLSQYGATSEECERMLSWAQYRRLPLFIRSELFREMKLCKQILRPLDEQRVGDSQESSQLIRGYSRQTGSCVSSLSNGASSTFIESQEPNYSWINLTYSAPQPQRTYFSQTASEPTSGVIVDDGYLTSCTQKDSDILIVESKTPKSTNNFGKESIPQNSSSLPKQSETKDVATGDPTSLPQSSFSVLTPKSQTKIREVTFSRENTMLSYKCDSQEKNEVIKHPNGGICPTPQRNDVSHHFFRTSSAPVCYRDLLRVNWYNQFDEIFGNSTPANEYSAQPFIDFNNGTSNDTTTDVDIHNMETRLQMTLHDVKRHIMGSHRGMKAFKQFLTHTAGIHLYNFWLDCEEFKDTMEEYIDSVNIQKRNQLFRDIQDKYKMSLTKEAKDQIQKSVNNVSLSHTIFVQTQYDVLRRLRTYWIPRYFLHLERNSKLLNSSLPQSHYNEPEWLTKDEQYGLLPFPSVSAEQFQKHSELQGNHNPVQSSEISKEAKCNLSANLRDSNNAFLVALTNDKRYGGPFEFSLKLKNDKDSLKSLYFWQAVTQYGCKMNESVDRHLCLEHAWDIYHNFIADANSNGFDLCKEEKEIIFNVLQNTQGYVPAEIFNPVKEHVVRKLETVWIEHLQDDLKSYFKCHIRSQLPEKDNTIQVSLIDGKLVIKHPKSRNETKTSQIDTLKQQPLRFLNDPESKEAWIEDRKMRERERKKSVRASLRRREELKRAALKSSHLKENAHDFVNSNDYSLSIPCLKDFVYNKVIMAAFKKFVKGVQDGDQVVSIVKLYADIENLKTLIDSGSSKQTITDMKIDLVNNIKDACLGENKLISVNTVFKNGEVQLMVGEDINTLDLSTLDRLEKNISGKVEDAFHSFLMVRCDECGIGEIELSQLNRTDIIALLTKKERETFTSQMTRKTTVQRKKIKSIAYVIPNKEEQEELLTALQQCSIGQMSVQLIYFHIYLTKHVDEDILPYVDKDLFFYIDVLRLKEAYKYANNERLLRKKTLNILEFYLESKTPPTVCIDIPNDMYQRTVLAAHNFLSEKQTSCNIFDEAQAHIFKELVMFWVNFRRTTDPAEVQEESKHQETITHHSSVQTESPFAKEIILPSVPKGTVRVLSYSLAEGVKWRPISSIHPFLPMEIPQRKSINFENCIHS
ncbi:uncharacterized protein LOC106867448 [Octopus bimaculoides]|uniref:uncharacterized protein LOC106867448 n=1 Tax=Octopus bimaculoides TaxID=37653 RepID=UPI00071D40AE|nr:uncharacterized protein LOC106867448 [Octopus bimaculoides]|eukprot:XP_014767812.1 PREDICTED: uncharacterized protein LOC106867448 isoform X2 [Octopus bimaculoides]